MKSPLVRRHRSASSIYSRIDAGVWILACGWAGLLALSLFASVRANRATAEEYARTEARAIYDTDLSFRRWATRAGGLYVHPSADIPPNPYLQSLPERDVVTTGGTPLTLVNPAYMTRLVHELADDTHLRRTRITSLRPIRPENAADPWETRALHSFENGAAEACSIVEVDGQPSLRFMRPFFTEAGCLKCHAAQGYRVGEIRGGISTTIPLGPFYATAYRTIRTSSLIHLLVAAAGFAGLLYSRHLLRRILLDRDTANAALRESEHRNRQLIERLPLVAITCTADGTITHANPALTCLAGRPMAEMIGRNFFELLVPRERRDAEEQEWRRFLQGKELQANTTGAILAGDNRPRTIAWRHTRLTDLQGESLGVSSLGEDITVRSAEDLRLRLLSLAVEQSPAVVVITDATGTIEYVNHRFSEVTGYLPAEVLGQNPRILSAGDTPAAFYAELWRTILAGHEWHGVFHNRRKNGDHFWESAHLSPIRDGSGTIVRFVALKEDITERRRTEQALADSEQRFRTLIEHAPVAIIVHHEHRCLYANTSALRLFGYDEHADITGIDIRTHIAPASLPIVMERVRRTSPGTVSPPVELGLRRCDGSDLVCESINSAITFNGQPANLALIVDITERRQMLAALEESEARYRTLVEVAPVAIFSLSQDRFTYANPGAARLFGFASAQELVGTSIWQRAHADSLAALTELLTRVQSGETRTLAEISLLGREHQRILCGITAVAMQLGQQSAVLALAVDITERRQLENALHENEARIRETLESTAAGYFLLDRQDRVAHANSAFLGLFEQPTLAAVRGRPFVEILPEPERHELSEHLLRLACGEEFVGGELRHRRADGSHAYLGFTAHLVRDNGALAGSEGFILDTTAARTSEDRYLMLFERMLDGFALHEIVYDEDGHPDDYRFLAANPAFERLLGRPAAEVVGRRARELFPALDPKWIERYARVAVTGEPAAFTDYSPELDRWFEIAAFRPAERQFACLVRDITAKRLLEQQLQQAQKMEAVGQLAGGIAHDYNNILVAILMNLALLRDESGLRPETAQSLVDLEREAKRAAALTRQLLVFSRREAAQIAAIDFNEQLENMLNMLRRLLGEQVTIATRLAPDLPPISADPGMMDQVVMNLCVNARDAMPAGGTVELSTSRASFAGPSTAHPEARAGTFLQFVVHDNGSGIDAETRAHIFEPFFTTKESGRGTGLGLATVFGIVQQHHGWIEVESAPGQGSTFRVFLPLASTLPATAAAPAPRSARSAGETILLVEDDAVARQTMTLTLRRDGYQILEARNVGEALVLWERHRDTIAALITDVVMPGGRSGLELAQQLHAERPGLSIVIISGYSDDAVRKTGLVEGAAYLAKPFDYDTLTGTLHACLGRRPAT